MALSSFASTVLSSMPSAIAAVREASGAVLILAASLLAPLKVLAGDSTISVGCWWGPKECVSALQRRMALVWAVWWFLQTSDRFNISTYSANRGFKAPHCQFGMTELIPEVPYHLGEGGWSW